MQTFFRFPHCLFILAVLLCPGTAIANEPLKLQLIVSNAGHSEILVFEKNEQFVTWTVVRPGTDEVHGKIGIPFTSIENVASAIIKEQTSASQRQRLRLKNAYTKSTIVMMLVGKGRRISHPLTDQEHRKLSSTDFMRATTEGIRKRNLLSKTLLLMDLLFPDNNKPYVEDPKTNLKRRSDRRSCAREAPGIRAVCGRPAFEQDDVVVITEASNIHAPDVVSGVAFGHPVRQSKAGIQADCPLNGFPNESRKVKNNGVGESIGLNRPGKTSPGTERLREGLCECVTQQNELLCLAIGGKVRSIVQMIQSKIGGGVGPTLQL